MNASLHSRAMLAPLFIPASEPKFMSKAADFASRGIVILDLEDSVSPPLKDMARDAARSMIASIPRRALVRVNQISSDDSAGEGYCGETDLCSIVQPGLLGVVIPKVARGRDLTDADSVLRTLERMSGASINSIGIVALIETAQGVANLDDIVGADLKRPLRLAFGAGDYTTDLQIEWTEGEEECSAARAMVVLFSRAANLPSPIDSAFTNVGAPHLFRQGAEKAKSLGFGAKLAIHPSQVEIGQKVFMPSEKDVAWAHKVLAAAQESDRQGRGAFMVDGKMVDIPIVKRASDIMAFLD